MAALGTDRKINASRLRRCSLNCSGLGAAFGRNQRENYERREKDEMNYRVKRFLFRAFRVFRGLSRPAKPDDEDRKIWDRNMETFRPGISARSVIFLPLIFLSFRNIRGLGDRGRPYFFFATPSSSSFLAMSSPWVFVFTSLSMNFTTPSLSM